MKPIHTDRAPAAIGPYSQGITAGDFLFTSGQIGLTPAGDLVEDNIAAQAEQALKNLQAIAQAAGTDLSKTVKSTCFITDMNNFAAFNTVYSKYITTSPARSFVAVRSLPKDALCEIELVISLK